jgi:hypothetical protein
VERIRGGDVEQDVYAPAGLDERLEAADVELDDVVDPGRV